jgi:hypothetical protein
MSLSKGISSVTITYFSKIAHIDISLTFGLESLFEIVVIHWFCENDDLRCLDDDADPGESGLCLGVESRLTLNILCPTCIAKFLGLSY